jgi:hypothetical protein
MTLHLSAAALRLRNREKQAAWRRANQDRVNGYYEKYRATGMDKPRKAAWALANKDRVNTRRRALYREKHPVVTAFVDRAEFFLRL